MTNNTDPVRALADLAERAVPFLRDEAAKYDDDGSNEPLELAREIETALASLPSDESALSSANSAFDGGREAAPCPHAREVDCDCANPPTLASAPPSAPVGVDAVLGFLPAPLAHSQAWPQEYVDGFNACAKLAEEQVRIALAQQPAAPSGEAVAYRWRDRGTMQMVYSSTNPGYCNVEHLYAAPQQPAAVDGGLTDEAIERALEARLGLDHTLRQLIRGDTMPVGYSKVEVVRALLRALAAHQQGGAA